MGTKRAATPGTKPAAKKAGAKKAAKSAAAPGDVAAFLDALDHPRKAEILAIRQLVLDADPGIAEEVKWNAPSFRTASEHFATFHLRGKDGVMVVLHLGAKARADAGVREAVRDPAGLLEWKGRDRAVVTFRDLADVKSRGKAFADVVRQWIRHV